MGILIVNPNPIFDRTIAIVELVPGAVIRTLDVGADKLMRMQVPSEPNPALGLRAIRYCLKHRDVFRTQLRAILKASVLGNVSIMFPMISGLQ